MNKVSEARPYDVLVHEKLELLETLGSGVGGNRSCEVRKEPAQRGLHMVR